MGTTLDLLHQWAEINHSIKFMVLVIGPEEAEELLNLNNKNRPLADGFIAQYARDMKDGLWSLNGEALIFSTDGRLLNGQHRLHAVIRSGSVIEVAAIYGIHEDAFDTMDAGKKRGVSDLLGMRDVRYQATIAGAVSNLFYMAAGVGGAGVLTLKNYRPSKAVAVKTAMDNLEYLLPACEMTAKRPTIGIVGTGLVAVLACMIASGKKPEAQDFLTKLSSGEGIVRGDPEYAFRQKVLDVKLRGATLNDMIKMAYLIKCASAKISTQKVLTLRLNEGEPFPAMPGLEAMNIKSATRDQRYRSRA
jgi:hypothetical protein